MVVRLQRLRNGQGGVHGKEVLVRVVKEKPGRGGGVGLSPILVVGEAVVQGLHLVASPAFAQRVPCVRACVRQGEGQRGKGKSGKRFTRRVYHDLL